MKSLLTLVLLASTLCAHAQLGIELGDTSEFNQLVANPARIGNKPLAFDKNNTPYFCYTTVNQAPGAALSGTLKVLRKSGTSWIPFGGDLSFAGQAYHPVISFDRFDTLYLAFYNPFKITVLKWSGSTWLTVGSPQISLGTGLSPIFLKFDKNNTPYISGSDDNGDGSVLVMKYNGTDWITVHAAGNLKKNVGSYTMDIPAGDTAVYISGFASGYSGAKGTTVLRYSPELNTWDTVGQPQVIKDTSATNPQDMVDCSVFFDSKGTPFHYGVTLSGTPKLFQYNGSTWDFVNDLPVLTSAPFFDKNDNLYALGAYFSGSKLMQYLIKLNGSNWDTLGLGSSVYAWESKIVAELDTAATPHLVQELPSTLKPEIVRLKQTGNEWEPFGGTVKGKIGLSAGKANHTKVVLDKTAIPLVLFQDETAGKKATVRRWISNNWVTVGAQGFSAGIANDPDIAVDSASGSIYVLYGDEANSHKTTLKQFDGTNWVNIGAAGFSDDSASFTSLVIDHAGAPVVVYSDAAKGGKATVKKFSGTWGDVGAAGFSTDKVSFTSVVVNELNQPYVAYVDHGNGEKATVKMYNGTAWVAVGNPDISPAEALFTKLVRSQKGDLYLMFVGKADRKITVKKLESNNWKDVGAAAFSDSITGGPSIGLDRTGSPLVVYPGGIVQGRGTMQKFNGSQWVIFGAPGFSAGGISSPSIAVNPVTDETYVTYSSVQAFARKLLNTNVGIKDFSETDMVKPVVFPNPSNNSFIIRSKTILEEDIAVFDINGKLLFNLAAKGGNEITCTDLPLESGIYLIKIGNYYHKQMIIRQ